MFSKKQLTLMVAAAATTMWQPAFAEEMGDKEVSLGGMVVTGTRSETPLLEQAGNTGKVSEEEIDLVRPDHISEILNRVSGVNIQHGNGQEHLTSIRSPVLTGGAGAGSFLFLEDGIPLRAAGFANVNGLFEVNYEQAGGIEVVRGPGSALYGSNAVHGLVNVLSRAPSLDLERQIDFSIGPHDLYQTKATISDTVGRHGYRLSVNGTTDGGYVSDSGYDQQKVSFRHDYLGDVDSFKTLFSYTNLNQETAGYITGYKVYEDESLSRQNPNPEAYRDAKSYRLSTEWIHELSDTSSFTLTPYVRHTEMNFLMHFLSPGKPVESNKHSSVGLLSSYTKELDGGHKIILGTDFEYTEGQLKEVQNNSTTVRGFIPGVHYDYDVDATVIAPYAHTEWQILDKTRLIAGVRYEYTKYDYTNNTTSGVITSRYYRPESRDDSFNNLSPKLGLVQELTDDTSAFINYARGNRAPQTTDLYRIQNNNGDRADSEQIDSIEVGVRKVGEGFQYEITAYHMRKKDYFFTDSNDINVNDGKTKHTGLELGMFYPFNSQFDVAANLTFAKHEYDFNRASSDDYSTIESGNYLVTAPKQMANVRLGWNFTPKSRAELEWEHMGEYYINDGNTAKYDGHDVFNLHASHQLTENLKLYGRVQNLFNTEYAERADFRPIPGVNPDGYRYFVGEKRYLHVGASYSF
ncbi:TonB-dependent receptor [Methylophaga thalassica]|uniref:TonB-dependent receptor n=1 Tax=Methylophaga thalassica TaxID=40223 RepID=A0ABQ5TXM7_9GAMM|nr:TonB-dependent receptor [Methylophaga thalassica]GLQ00526.1 TonB-dependent receptor [Methylophaga thalassica]